MRKRGTGHIRRLGGDTQYKLIYHNGRQCLEHRVIMEKVMGRALATDEVVHHIDGNGLNNDPSNLEIMKQADHRRMHSGPRRWNLEQAIEMRNAGATIMSIAVHFGVSDSAINKVLKRRGYSTSAPPRKPKFSRDEAVSLFRNGHNLTNIAHRLGVKPPSIRMALIKLGVIG